MPEFLKELFGDQALTYEQFAESIKTRGYKLADLSTGNYVDKRKYTDELSAKDTALEELKGQIKTRDGDIKNLKAQIAEGAEKDTKMAELNSQIEKLQGEYENAKKDYEARIGKHSYEFAVKEFANAQKFTSSAAKKQFINEMVSENLKMKNGNIIGADDYLKVYKEANEDSFVVEQQSGDEQQQQQQGSEPLPTFVQPTAPQSQQGDENPFISAFNFAGIRAKEN